MVRGTSRRYEQEIKRPLMALIEEMDVRLGVLRARDHRQPQKSLFRIHRDVRFSKDKSPYKTHAACWFYHRDAGRAVARERRTRRRRLLFPLRAR